MSGFLIGPKIPVIDEQSDGTTYGDNMRHVLRMLQALVECNVINMTTSVPPATPNNGDTYVVAVGPSGVWTGQAQNLAYWTTDDPNVPAGKWEFYSPLKGWVIGNQSDGNIYKFNGAAWVLVSGAPYNGSGATYGGALGLWPGNWIGCNATGVNGGSFLLSNMFTDFASTGSNSGDIPASATETQAYPIVLQDVGFLDSYSVSDQFLHATPGILRDWLTKTTIVGLTSSRYWIGLSDSTYLAAQTVMNSDTPAANFIGFRFSTGIDGATIKAVCQTGSGAQTVIDTGVAPTPSTPQVFEIVPTVNGTVILFYINGTLVATINTHVPAAATNMGSYIGVDGLNSGTSDGQLNFYYCYFLLNS